VVFEDTHLIVIDKPAGLLSQGEETGAPNVVDWLRQRFGRPYVGLVHRLDRNTSGLMVVAKRTKSAQRLTDSLQKGEIQRDYLAWMKGAIESPCEWRHSLVKDEATNTSRVVPEGRGGKIAVMTVTPVRGLVHPQAGVLTLASLRLETGRSHQIRVQAAHEGHPLLGDVKYKGPWAGFGRPALHSARLEIVHPMSREVLSWEAAMPGDMGILG
jgi:23S rRNA pseudouridine1911/1915/1917 synthase